MAYGLSLDQVRTVNHPTRRLTDWGATIECAKTFDYSLSCVRLKEGGVQPLHFYCGGGCTLYLEKGETILRQLDESGRPFASVLPEGAVYDVPQFAVHGLASRTGAEVYLIGPSRSRADPVLTESLEAAQHEFALLTTQKLPSIGRPTTDVHEKYWGRIETILDSEIAGKRIFLKKDRQSSLEFHLEKRESYWIRTGVLKLGLRVGRGENYSIVLNPGDSYDVRPGVMHMRMALEDTVIIEASTRDDDGDSYLVEDGQTYVHAGREVAQLQLTALEKVG